MINITDPQYWDKTSLLRDKQVWQSENQAEKEIIDDFIIFLEQVKREVGDLYAEYSVEGLLNYAEVNRMVNAGQLAVYRRMIEQVMNETQQIQDEYYRLELERLHSTREMTILDSKVNLIEVYLLVLLMKNTQTVSKSLSGAYESTYNHTIYDTYRKMGVAFSFEKLTKSIVMDRVVSDWSGDTFVDAIKAKRHTLIRDVKRTITTGIRRNQAYKKVVLELNNLVKGGKGYKGIHKVLRQETTRVLAESKAQSYEEAGITQYRYLATLDDRTTDICQRKDGNIYDFKDMQVGVNFPPLHFGCRSSITAYFPEDDMSEKKRTARSPVTGTNYKVPADISYQEWDRLYN